MTKEEYKLISEALEKLHEDIITSCDRQIEGLQETIKNFNYPSWDTSITLGK